MAEHKGGWIGVDLDGTLARYDGWKGETHVGAPIELMVDRIKGWLDLEIEVRIFTARVAPGPDRDLAAIKTAIEEWCEEHIGQKLEITCQKDFYMVELWDDRCVQVVPNTGRRADGK